MAKWFEPVDTSSLEANLAWRKKAAGRAVKDIGYRKMVRWQCKRDLSYALNAWCLLHEPRILFDERGKKRPHAFPFLTRPHQDRYIEEIEQNLGVKSIGIRKCRDEGFSWMFVYFAVRDFFLKEHVDIGFGSSTEAKSDTPGVTGSLGGKVDWAISQLPPWLIGKKGDRVGEGDWTRNVAKHSFIHNRRHNTITFYAATGEGPRSNRYTWYAFDEFGTREWWAEGNDKKAMDAVGATTQCKIYVSTPEGQHGEFYRIMTEPSDMVKIVMNWKDNREKARGLYKFNNGKPVAVDPENNPLLHDYNPPTPEIKDRWERLRKKGFTLDKTIRSPWYDRECDQPEAYPEMIAKNVDAEWGGSVSKIFDEEFFQVCKSTVRQPEIRGSLVVDEVGKWDFGRSETGEFKLWCPLDAQNKPPQRRYVVCMDLGHGRGGPATSNSALHVVDLATREQVLEFVSNTIDPVSFARLGVGVCKWFWDAYYAWEVNQPGNVVIDVVREMEYSHYYLRKTLDKVTKKLTERPGWHTDQKSKEMMFTDLRIAVKEGELILRSSALVEELEQYIRDPKTDKIEHAAAGKGHGDRVMAIGVGRQAMKDRPVQKKAPEHLKPWGDGPPPYGTPAHRDWEWAQEQLANGDDWDDRSTFDLSQSRSLHARTLGVA